MPTVVAKTIPQPVEFARQAVDIASDKQASDIVMLDLRGVCDFADYFVILSAESDRQLEGLAVEIEKPLGAEGATLHHREGNAQGGWILLDFGNVIVHLFRSKEREFYQIEGAWSRGIEAVRIQ